jgi:peroxiredoxin
VLSENINLLKNLQIGKKAPEFKLTSNNGDQVALSSLQGSIVLVDFWASWCAPCRRENPNLVNEFKKFNSKGFTILSVSVDSDQDAWRKAIVEDGLTWTQLIDTAGIANSLYGVRSIPTTYLLDKDGIIIGKNLKGEQLTAKLQEFLN